jgi:hypothetical protein
MCRGGNLLPHLRSLGVIRDMGIDLVLPLRIRIRARPADRRFRNHCGFSWSHPCPSLQRDICPCARSRQPAPCAVSPLRRPGTVNNSSGHLSMPRPPTRPLVRRYSHTFTFVAACMAFLAAKFIARKIRSCAAPLPASGVPNPYVDARGCHAIELLADVSSGFTQTLETENRWDRRAKSSRAHYAA